MKFLEILAADINAMDLTFTLKDVIYIVGGIFVLLGAWFKMKSDKIMLENRISEQNAKISVAELNMTNMKSDHEEKVKELKDTISKEALAAKSGRVSVRKETAEAREKNVNMLNGRINKAKEDIEKERERNDKEFKAINDNISSIKADTASIKAMLEALTTK